MSPPPLSPSDLIFPQASKTPQSILSTLSKSQRSISNRLHSIVHDAEFVEEVAEAYELPLVANQRCGSWYILPDRKAGSVYFKSTDGHFGQWGFSLRRLNLHLLEVIGEKGGCIIVDSTRRGKSLSDALSKTVPIWMAVLNRCLFPEQHAVHALQTPEDVVSRSEHAQIEQRLASFVEDLERLDLDTDDLRSKLRGKPLALIWVTPDSNLSTVKGSCADRNLIVLCTASGRTANVERQSSRYVQGAADDSESWACGLNAKTFWKHRELLLSTSEDDLPETIQRLQNGSDDGNVTPRSRLIKPTNISIGHTASTEEFFPRFDFVICCSLLSNCTMEEKLRSRYVRLACTTGKVGSRELRSQLPKLESLRSILSPASKVLVCCPTGRDLAVGVALAMACLFCNSDGAFNPDSLSPSLSKTTIKQRLSWIMLAFPEASPSRATLQSVNAYLLGRPSNYPT